MPRGKHGNHVRGENHPRWNSGMATSSHGYLKAQVGIGHPLADPKGYAYVHLLVWTAAGNRPPGEGESLHHKDGDKTNNRLGNLEMMSCSAHARLHSTERGRDSMGRFPSRAHPDIAHGATL